MTDSAEEVPRYSMRALLSVLGAVLCLIFTFGIQMRTATNRSIDNSRVEMRGRLENLSEQHRQTYTMVLELYHDLDDRIDRIENRLMIGGKDDAKD